MAAEDKTTPEVEKKEDDKPVVAETDDKKPDGDKKQDGDKKKQGGKRSKGEGKGQRTRAPSGPAAYNGYRLNVKNLSNETKDAAQLKALFAAHGALADVQVKTRDDGSSCGIGFVVFEKEEDAQKAMAAMHDKEIGGKKLDVKPAERRPQDDKGEGKGQRTRAPSGPTAYNGYRLNVKHLSNETKDAAQLKALFAVHGALADVQVKTGDDGSSRGIGFVVFEKQEDAQKAMAALHDKEIGGKKLNVQPAERRPDEGQDDKGKGKGKGNDMMQQYMAMQMAYFSALTQQAQLATSAPANFNSAEQKPGVEATLPGSYVGVLKQKLRYGAKSSYILCEQTRQYLKCDVHIEQTDIPEGMKEGDKIKFTVATMYKPWEWDKQQQTYLQLPARGYPKAQTAAKA